MINKGIEFSTNVECEDTTLNDLNYFKAFYNEILKAMKSMT